MPASDKPEQNSARRALRVLRRRLPIILVAFLVAPAVTVGYSLTQPKKYTAEAILLFRAPG